MRVPEMSPEPPSAANDHHQQLPANMKLGRPLNPRPTHENTLVMRSSLDSDRDPKHEAPPGPGRWASVSSGSLTRLRAGRCWLCRTGMAGVSIKVKSGASPMVGGWLAPPDWAHAVPITELISWRKLTQPMYESDEDRVDAAEHLAEHNPHAAEAFSAIACDRTVGDEVRLSAAELLADVDPRAAAPACLAIARDRTVGDEVRLSAAERLADVDPRAAAPACLAIACDQAVGDEVRLSAAELLADVDPRAAAPACLAIARDGTVGDEVRRSAAERLAGLATL